MKANNHKKVMSFNSKKKVNTKPNSQSGFFGGNQQQNRAQFFKDQKEKSLKKSK